MLTAEGRLCLSRRDSATHLVEAAGTVVPINDLLDNANRE